MNANATFFSLWVLVLSFTLLAMIFVSGWFVLTPLFLTPNMEKLQ